MIELAVLDMAGTTIDDGGAVYRALEQAVRDAGASLTADDLQTWMGTDKVTAITNLLRLGGVEPTAAVVEAGFARFKAVLAATYAAEPPVALPGVGDALAELRRRGILVALSTGFDREVATGILDTLGWTVGSSAADTIDALVTTSEVPAGRPAPYLIHHAMELTGVQDVRLVLAAGDTAVDVLAARNAGVIAVGVLTGAVGRETLEALPHDHVLDGVIDLVGLPECQAAREAQAAPEAQGAPEAQAAPEAQGSPDRQAAVAR
ncbi:phosphonatase-like hydrolase [Frondihabitans cladoniiphilus]|uniref:Phosphonatase-like hydrolase n=1 Tax=Frondihabitans cladoniiphilus TaxID=715785 RepID=A0ABP8VHC8_9MICO